MATPGLTKFGPLAQLQRVTDPEEEENKPTVEKPVPIEAKVSPLAGALINNMMETALQRDVDPYEAAEQEYKGMGLGQKLLKGFLVGGIPGAFLGGARSALVKRAIQKQQQQDDKLRRQVATANAVASLTGVLKTEPIEPHELVAWRSGALKAIDEAIELGLVKPEERVSMFREAMQQKMGIRDKAEKSTKLEEILGQLELDGASPEDRAKAVRIEAGLEPRASGPLRKIIEDDFGNVSIVDEDGAQRQIGKVSVRPKRTPEEMFAELSGMSIQDQADEFAANVDTKEDLNRVPTKLKALVSRKIREQNRVLMTEKQKQKLNDMKGATAQLDQVMDIALGNIKWNSQVNDFVPVEDGQQVPIVLGKVKGAIAEKYAQWTGRDPEISKFEEVQNSMLSNLVKAIGRDSGNLAEGDINRAAGFKVSINDTEEEVRWKQAYWRRLMGSIQDNLVKSADGRDNEIVNPHENAVKYAERFKPGKIQVGDEIEIP